MEKVEHFIEKFIPENYKIYLEIDRKEKSFKGSVKIKAQALDKNISLHQKDLKIKHVKILDKQLNFKIDNERDAVDITLDKIGDVVLDIEFAAVLTDNMTGIYPSYYTQNGVKKELVSTQFESHFAREAFPCIDEPEAKASFDLAIKFDQAEGELVISNMPEIRIEERKLTGIWRFDTSPVMSSYLLAFALGDMQSKMGLTKNGTKVGIFATNAHPSKSLDFSLDIAIKSIEFYEDYFAVKYPLKHSYHVALPDFSAGAMENWGLITYREIFLLVDDNSTAVSRQEVALVIAHEVAHQWFGNLVTMKWWDDLWLNESFANMMEYVCVEAIHPEWNIFENFQTGGLGHALKRDATDGVQSVHVEVNHPDEINTLFDPAIVYAKGSRLMHMLRRWLGDEAFAKGLTVYFEKHKYKNTIGRDLWDALSESSGKDVASFMDAWLEQPGYPLLTVKKLGNKIEISQKQLFIGKHQEKHRTWQIPLNSNWQGIPDILSETSLVIDNYSQLKAKNKNALRFNTENTAHYIINYEGQLFIDLMKDFGNLDKLTKLQVISDYNLLAESGQISFAKVVELLPLLTNEKSYVVNSAISKIIDGLKRFVDEGSEEEKKFKEIVSQIFKSNFARLGFIAKQGETDEDEMLRQITLSFMIYADDKEAIDKAYKIYDEYEDNLESIPAAIRSLVLTNQMKHKETKKLVDLYLDLYVKTVDANFKGHLVSALSNTKSDETVEKVLQAMKDKDLVKPQDLAISWYGSFLAKDYSQNKFWIWACQNWDWIVKTLGGDMSFDKFVIYPAMMFKTRECLDKYKEFFEPKLKNMAISRSILMGINEIEARVELIEKQKEQVKKAILKW